MAKLPFAPKVFFAVLAAVALVLVVVFWIVKKVAGEVTTTDLVGGSISSVIFAYFVHLWLIPNQQGPNREGKR